MKSGDGAEDFFEDVKNGKLDQWLLKNLVFVCLDSHNHMRTFRGSDGRYIVQQEDKNILFMKLKVD